jgi:hypothetical protein
VRLSPTPLALKQVTGTQGLVTSPSCPLATPHIKAISLATIGGPDTLVSGTVAPPTLQASLADDAPNPTETATPGSYEPQLNWIAAPILVAFFLPTAIALCCWHKKSRRTRYTDNYKEEVVVFVAQYAEPAPDLEHGLSPQPLQAEAGEAMQHGIAPANTTNIAAVDEKAAQKGMLTKALEE